MFDGNHKSHRQVNFGNSRHKRGRGDILEQSRRLREERQRKALENLASLRLQRIYRGHRDRQKLAVQLELALHNVHLDVGEYTRLLNLRLGLGSIRGRHLVLSSFAEKIDSDRCGESCVLAHRIVLSSLQADELPEDVLMKILMYCLSDPNESRFWLQLHGLEGLMALVSCWRRVESNGLWEVLKRAAPKTEPGRALLCATLFSSSRVLDKEVDVYENLFLPMVSVLTKTASHGSSPCETELVKATRRIVSNATYRVLCAAMALFTSGSHHPSSLILLLDQTINSELFVLSGTVVATGKMQIQSAGAQQIDRIGKLTDDEHDSDSEIEETSIKSLSSTGRLTRQELQTVQWISRLYLDRRTTWTNDILSQKIDKGDDYLINLSEKLGNPELWLFWGNTLLSDMGHNSVELQLTREAYIQMLARLLQSCNGLQPRQSAMSPFFTKLAFAEGFLARLWSYVLVLIHNDPNNIVSYTAFSVFCDIFSHNLIALKDDQFLAKFTTLKGSRVILVEHVIIHLRNALYETYWSLPVRANDIVLLFSGLVLSGEDSLHAARARMLLTGTKLWNSLYERWCRLVRHSPFCDESTWLFPKMTTLSVDGAVVPEGARSHLNLDRDGMQIEVDDETSEGNSMSAAEEEHEALADAFSEPRTARILTSIPQAIPFDRRVKLFDALLRLDKDKTQNENEERRDAIMAMTNGGQRRSRELIEIRRDQLYDDSMHRLNQLGPKLKKKVQVVFFNQHGTQESGIDGGGVFKEFIDDLIKDAFSPANTSTASNRLFMVTPLQTLAVNSELNQNLSLLPHYEFLGRVLGKAVYESILVEPQFCLPFLNQLVGKSNSLEDLQNYDPEYYKNVTKLLSLSPPEIDSMGLTFELTLGAGSSSRTVELLPGGKDLPVTTQNAIQYVHLLAHRRLNIEGSRQVKAFLRGFRDLIPASWVRLFSAYELQKLVSGDDTIRGIDVASLKASTQYASGFHPSQPAIQWFWEIIEELTPGQQRKFLKFMTSCSRPPLLGFESLVPAPCIQQIRLPDALFLEEEEVLVKRSPLPTSSTCMNLLKLPNYGSKKLMRNKLTAAIESGSGFELT
jgi:ubiquitin-protein ligase E3 C